MEITSIAQLVRAARNGRSQKEFALELGVQQSTVSRYERGKTNPPVRVIEHCMHLAHVKEGEVTPTADELAAMVHSNLSDPDMADIRLALARLIGRLLHEHSEAHAMSHSSR